MNRLNYLCCQGKAAIEGVVSQMAGKELAEVVIVSTPLLLTLLTINADGKT